VITILAVFFAAWIVSLGLLLGGRMPLSARVPVVVAMMLGMAAWLLVGQPGVAGAPVAAPENESFGEALDDPRNGMSDRFGPASQWLGLSDAMIRRGRTQQAAEVLVHGLRRYPRNIDLWVGYGNALVAHSGGIMTPAAAMAFDRAAAIDPSHPAPAFFAGLALAQGGNTDGARVIWQELLARSPGEAPYRADLESRLAQLPPASPMLPTRPPSSAR
jgi:cytochrome c-type biogenesis protein CcmH/NrfG